MNKDFEFRLTMLLSELDLQRLGDRETQVFDELKKQDLFLGYNMTDVVASIVFYTQRELGNYIDMVDICKEIGALKTTVFRLVGKIGRYYGTSYIVANPSTISRVEQLIKKMWPDKEISDADFNYLLEGFNTYEALANEHGLHKGRGYYGAITYLLLKPKGYSQTIICSHINCTPVSIRNNIKQIKEILEV